MGQSTNGILAYGYNLGGEDGGWEIREAGEDGEWLPPWLADEDDDVMAAGERVLLASVGLAEAPWVADGYGERYRAAKAHHRLRRPRTATGRGRLGREARCGRPSSRGHAEAGEARLVAGLLLGLRRTGMASESDQSIYLVVMDTGGLFGTYLDRDRAFRSAEAVGGVVAELPITADYRPAPAPAVD